MEQISYIDDAGKFVRTLRFVFRTNVCIAMFSNTAIQLYKRGHLSSNIFAYATTLGF